jgi:hypothetical protein
MTTLEDRVRAAARAAAATVAEGSAPPLTLAQPERRPGRRGWGGRHPWILSLAAAAAVIALIAASIFAAHAVVPATRRPAPGSPLAPLPRLADGLPAYFLENSISVYAGAEPGGPPSAWRGLPSHETLRVVATATGKVAATATLPGYVAAIAASRGAFFAAVVKDNLARFYEVRLKDSHTATTVTKLPIRPDTAPLAFMAVSPDGTKLAYSIHVASGAIQDLVVASTIGGSQREWLTPPQDSRGWMFSMSWLADDRTLAFNWAVSQETASSTYPRLLDTDAPGSDLMASRRILPSVYDAHRVINDTTLSPDGQVVVGAANSNDGNRAPLNSVVAFSTATGEETVLYRASPNGTYDRGCYSPPVWISNAGSEVLVSCFQAQRVKSMTPRFVIMLINHGHTTVLPWLSGIAMTALGHGAAFP